MHLPSLPSKLLSSLEGIRGFNRDSFEKVHQTGERVTSIRLNPNKQFDISNFAHHEKIPWSQYGYYLSTRPSFTLDPFFHAGLYYVQEASSVFLETALKQTINLSSTVKILDLCAAPGGKSTLIQSIISNESLLVSNEVIKSRVGILQENIVKWGASNIIITNNDPADFGRLQNYFDAIVVDAPCSGSGLFRRDPEAINEWSEENVKLCSLRQQRIVADAWPALKKGGILIYSTCSYSKQENEDNIDWLMDQFNTKSLQLKLYDGIDENSNEKNWPVTEVTSDRHRGYGYRFYPDQVKGEGFFIACLQKKDGDESTHQKIKKDTFEKLSRNEIISAGKYIGTEKPIAYFKHNDMVYALPELFSEAVSQIRNSLYLRKAGILMGKFAGYELIPEHDLALSTIINASVPALELTKDEAISYLRKEEMKTESTIRGWALARFQNQNLGWMKLLQKRINNYYPKEWRVRKVSG